ncbi:6-phosphogluconate dehydrogenase, C-terminal-like [Pseudocohnilembus persalinus]|uniref:Glycerol-3-phosphate dehydrogenase [NAD(+)] n=1 Tax=Pseudocohnilembus persalinus TaxID=266149 RepID=A0A0V0QEP5_PSEPJ|nr:6-phosphogluconate dehydrogenase, C-terminal-like [Pseudocohnilembus persalinus]|eukprot:KRX00662.1 6-phosphogluconate dehydrogenase, C-terminal-like [Pseudocohnilembus persalinus]
MSVAQIGKKITVLGGGAFGTAMAHCAALNELNQVTLYARDKDTVECINKFQINPKKLSQFKLSPKVTATNGIYEALQGADCVISCIPTQQILPTMQQYKNIIPTDKPFVNCSKGMIVETEQFPSQAMHSIFGEDFKFYSLSGPSFADEIMKGNPTLLVLAGKEGEERNQIMEALSHKYLRIYGQEDVLGVEIAGAMKNVISIGAGIIIGYGYGLNTVTGFVVKATHEMQLMAKFFGADPKTFFGLAGIGDLILTSFGSASRNRTFGEKFGQGMNLAQIFQTSTGVVEGYYTLDAIHKFAQENNLDMPIVDTIYKVVHGELTIEQAATFLMSRKLSKEYNSMLDDLNDENK